VGSATEVVAGDKVENSIDNRLDLLRGGFSKASGRRTRGVGKVGSRGGKKTNDRGKRRDGGA
jgi:hypothetical protein